MAESLSTGFVDAVNATGSVKAVMADGVIALYSGSPPANADAAETGDLLGYATLESGAFTPGVATNGLEMGTSTGGVLSKAAGEIWSGVGLAAASTGTVAGWFRWYDNARTLGASTTAVRVDGAIGGSASFEMQGSNVVIVEGVEFIISTFTYTQPKA